MGKRGSCCDLMSKSVLPVFSSKSFIFSGLTFKSLIHLPVVSFAIIFSHSEVCLLMLFIISFAVQKLLSLSKFHFFFFKFPLLES